MDFDHPETAPAEPSATVVLVRDGEAALEVLMVRRSSGLRHMGGMWVFPGGRVDPADGDIDADADAAALNAAIRETLEETGLVIASDHLFQMSHWTTPVGAKRRFATWFFAGVLDAHQEVVVDGGEIADHRWISPAAALEEQRRGELRLMPPQFITLLELDAFRDCGALSEGLGSRAPIMYAPRVTQLDEAMHFLYEGDAGFDSHDPSADGSRHRCIMLGQEMTYLRDY